MEIALRPCRGQLCFGSLLVCWSCCLCRKAEKALSVASTTSIQEKKNWSNVLIKDQAKCWNRACVLTKERRRWVWCLARAPQP